MFELRYLFGSALVILLFDSIAANAEPSFMGVGDLPGGAFESGAFDVSADGSTVVGESEGEAFISKNQKFDIYAFIEG